MARTISVRLSDDCENNIENIRDYLETYYYENFSLSKEYTDSEIVRMALQKLSNEIDNKR